MGKQPRAALKGMGVLLFVTKALCATSPDQPSVHIVMLKDGPAPASTRMAQATSRATERAKALGAKVLFEYHAIGGYAASMTADQAEQIRQYSEILSVKKDINYRLVRPVMPPSPPGKPGDDIWPPKEWALDRIDQRDLPLDKKPFQLSATGEGVHAYTIDSGILKTHSEFTDRIGNGYNTIAQNDDVNDDHHFINVRGHGTMTASIICGTRWGVAKKATIHPVKALDSMGNGKGAHILAAINWITANAIKPAVCNMSIEADCDEQEENPAVRRMIQSGVIAVAAAGNSSHDASKSSPGSIQELLTVGAIDNRDRRCHFSNFGPCVDLFAPGFMVGGASNKDDNAAQAAQGTSQAAPYVTGAVACYLQYHPKATMEEVHQAVCQAATPDKVKDPKACQNRILYVNDAWLSQ